MAKNALEKAAVKYVLKSQPIQFELTPLPKRDYAKLLSHLYAYPPMEYFSHYFAYPHWGLFWGCEAYGIFGVNRSHIYAEQSKTWYSIDSEAFPLHVSIVLPLFYRRSYQRYKENGAICSGYPYEDMNAYSHYCVTDPGDEWRKAVGWLPDSVERKSNGPLKKKLYTEHHYGLLREHHYQVDLTVYCAA
jgi:hypothetical protein